MEEKKYNKYEINYKNNELEKPMSFGKEDKGN